MIIKKEDIAKSYNKHRMILLYPLFMYLTTEQKLHL